MKAVALIVDGGTPDLTTLAHDSIRAFASEGVTPRSADAVRETAQPHADTLEMLRTTSGFRPPWRWPVSWSSAGFDVVIFFDSDAMVCSPRWWPALRERFEAGATVVGGLRSRGDASQMFLDGVPMLHASMLAMTRAVFEKTSSFRSEWDQTTDFCQVDTAARVSLEAAERGERVDVLPFFRVGHGPRFPGLQVGEYFEPGERETLWAHCWRGTSMRGVTWRNRLGAWLGSPRSRTWMGAQERKRRYLEIGRQILESA